MNEFELLRALCELSLRYPRMRSAAVTDAGNHVSVEFHEASPAPVSSRQETLGDARRKPAPRAQTTRELIAQMKRAQTGIPDGGDAELDDPNED